MLKNNFILGVIEIVSLFVVQNRGEGAETGSHFVVQVDLELTM